jgi:uncharacterized membrane protein YraQ (UPF0718 family)
MNIGFLVLFFLLVILMLIALRRGAATYPKAVQRLIEQFAMLVPKMLCALIAAGFIAKLIPNEYISRFLGTEAGLLSLVVAALVGLIVPAGPVIAFAVAAVFAKAGASVPALITFISSWSLYAAHRIFIYELPLLGPSFLRLRTTSVLVIPFAAGLFAFLLGLVMTFGPVAVGS